MKLFVIVPTYNEKENISDLVGDILGLEIKDTETGIIIVDDNSPDGTGEIADSLAAADPAVCVIHREGKLGLGTAYIAGMRLALEKKGDCIMTMDADFSHNPSYIPDIIKAMGSSDIVIGSRYVSGGGTRHWGLKRIILSKTANLIAKLMLKFEANDCTAGFRCYRRAVLEAVNLDNIFSNGYSFLVEMLYRCRSKNFRVGEVPIIFVDRTRGKSKISRKEIYKAMLTLVKLRFGGFLS